MVELFFVCQEFLASDYADSLLSTNEIQLIILLKQKCHLLYLICNSYIFVSSIRAASIVRYLVSPGSYLLISDM